MRLVGPNCLGVLNTDPAIGLNATFAPNAPPIGHIAFLSQSGAMGIAVIDEIRALGIGLSSFASVGDKADLSSNDFLSFWEHDTATEVVLLYLESFGNPRKFSRIARRVARRKPIVVVKGGRSGAGAQAAGSHTGALLSASDATVQALFEQAGVIPTDTLGELFDVAMLLASQPPPRGPRVGIVSNGGGLGILCADACDAAGLDVVALPDELANALRTGALEGASLRNPVDLLAAATPEHFEHAIRLLGASGAVDAVIALYVPPMISDPVEIARAIRRGATDVPLAAVLAMADPPLAELDDGSTQIPAFRFPENAARAVARAAAYGRWLAEPDEPTPVSDADVLAGASIVARALERGPGWLEPDEVAALLDAHRIPRPAQVVVSDVDGAAAAIGAVGAPVALKAVAPGLVHRTDAGAVVVGLRDEITLRHASEAMAADVAASGYDLTGFVVQAMAPAGVEMLVGVVADPMFGSVVACAAGGTAAEVLGDSAVRLGPLTTRTAGKMLRSLRTFPLLEGFGVRHAVTSLRWRICWCVCRRSPRPIPRAAEIECNPVVVGASGVLAVDARARVQSPPSRAPEPALPAT